MSKYFINYRVCALFFTFFIFSFISAYALDTEIYQADIKQNAYILLDNSGSMDYGVYESNVDYGAMYDYLYIKSNIIDTISDWYNDHYETRKIFLAKGEISVTIIDDGEKTFTGDAADPDYRWYSNDMVDTHTYIDTSGNLSGEEGYTQRVTSDNEGHVLLDGSRLPLGQDILLKDSKTLYDGSMINEGFGGMLNAPGYYFSGFEGVNAENHNPVEDGDEDIYFFITGNWMNMQQMYNLHYKDDKDKPAWKYEKFPLESDDWNITTLSSNEYDYPPGSGDYSNDQDKTMTVSHSGATKMQIHFSLFDIHTWGSGGSWSGYDYVALYDSASNLIGIYSNNNHYGEAIVDGWSPVIDGDTVTIKIHTNSYYRASGITIDQYRSGEGDAGGEVGTYLMQNRLEVAKDAISYVLDEFRGKINWGFSTFDYTGQGDADGAKIYQVLNPSLNDDANRVAIEAHMKNIEPMGGTPLGEALQDIYEDGYHKKASVLSKLLCRRNFVIVLSDGFPSGDFDWSRTSYVKPFTDIDDDGFTADPYQYPNWSVNYLPDNYYDDVATWISHHSWIDGSVIADADIGVSYENITPHQIAFGAKHPLMLDAAEESGAEYITAYNKAQLVNAFHSLGLMISQSVSFTSPVVSVAADNKIENGNDIYMGLFLPMEKSYWKGNLKHFQLGDGSTDRPEKWTIYDAGSNDAQGEDEDGVPYYLDNTDGYWGDDTDDNDSNDNNGVAEIDEDGVGEVLTERVQANYDNGTYFARNIKTWVDDDDELTDDFIDFTQNIRPTVFGFAEDDDGVNTRNKIVNWVYGYAYSADENGNPIDVLDEDGYIEQTAVRGCALGPIIHSKPTIIDYYNSSDSTIVDKRYIAVGADDGMLHIFNDNNDGTPDGTEVFAFVPDDILTKLSAVETSLHESFVDGFIRLYREDGAINGAPKYLFFGLRRGGSSVWRIDVSDSNVANWTVAKISESEMGQSWSDFSFARIRTDENTFKDVIIFSGGYDPAEDMFPEPFTDDEDEPNGTPFKDNGTIDTQEWKSSNSEQDINGNGQYDISNPNTGAYATTKGRAIYVVDIDTLDVLFSVKHGETSSPALGTFNSDTSQLRADFSYCFPATPSVVVTSSYINDIRQDNLLTSIYAPDIYGNLFRIAYDYNEGAPQWQVKHIFSANPASSSDSGELDIGVASIDTSDVGRKVFYGPAVSWGGSEGYFQANKYNYPDAEFFGKDKIASLFFGTGDRVHPTYTIVRNRFYAVYDDSAVSATNGSGDVAVSSVAYSEDDLLNLTCDELGKDTTQKYVDTDTYKTTLRENMRDDVFNLDSDDPMELDSGGKEENDAKGWYIILDEQGDSAYCEHCTYEATVDDSDGGHDNHDGEKILSRVLLLDGKAIFTAYQTALDDPCTPQGNGFLYGLNYTDGSAALNLNSANDDDDADDPLKKDVTDRYGKYFGIKVIPSSPVVVVRDREYKVFTNFAPPIDPEHDSKPDLYYWIEH